MTDIHQALLAALKDSSSINPISFKDLTNKLAHATAMEIATALTTLYDNKVINRCYMQKSGWSDNVYWPTAKALQPFFNGRLVTGELHKLKSVPRRSEIQQSTTFSTIQNQEVNHMPPISTTSLIKSIINESPGIAHDALMLQIAGPTTDEIKLRKAQDMIHYVLKKGGHVKRNEIRLTDGAAIKCYYNTNAGTKEGSGSPTEPHPAQAADASTRPIDDVTAMDKVITTAPITTLQTQEGGDHYKKMAIQPIEYILANNLGFAEGSIIKYVSRYKNKNGIEDLKKARHFIEMLIELQSHI